MKTIGLIGGLSWESSSVYYSYINRFVQESLGGINSAKCLLYSFNFEEVAALQKAGEWAKLTDEMIHAAKTLENSGADMIVICTNTMHKMVDEMKSTLSIPIIHIVDCVVEAVKEKGLAKVGLLGTRFTMEQPFYREILEKSGIEVIIPNDSDREVIHNVIYQELCKGELNDSSKQAYLDIIQSLHKEGAEGIILGCTEIPLLIQQVDTSIPVFDTTYLHSKKVAEIALVD
ncbi:aspartate/glutamate racemase family protein [Ferdinandcohnia quinoae]|uniref:Aspartate/glutamate racemase family protein n=1 Tax=Fredinandcohnia quinoae TaxID=2918902 RepID=A0AAW5E165_9BACI|nr:aspartate/glutamate racemase family protein [Fredinandcohnia sp. SECRCQ15]MCH1625025.1 aspartate/glutamate racemase family protein [Fredinandcohnia sp. SECRCQ15]